MVIVRQRPGHTCQTAILVIAIVMWDGIPETQATSLYDYLRHTLPENGLETERRCGTNEKYAHAIPSLCKGTLSYDMVILHFLVLRIVILNWKHLPASSKKVKIIQVVELLTHNQVTIRAQNFASIGMRKAI
jgi:hypothetical protein